MQDSQMLRSHQSGDGLVSKDEDGRQVKLRRFFWILGFPIPKDLSIFCNVPPRMGQPGYNNANCHTHIDDDTNRWFGRDLSWDTQRHNAIDCCFEYPLLQTNRTTFDQDFSWQDKRVALERTLEKLQSSGGLPRSHPACLRAMYKLGKGFFDLQNFPEAGSWFCRILYEVNGLFHGVEDVLYHYFLALMFDKKFKRVKDEIEQLLPGLLELPYRSWILHMVIVFMGTVCVQLNEFDQAEKWFHHWVYISVTEYGLVHEDTYEAISKLATVKRTRMQISDSRELFELILGLRHQIPQLTDEDTIREMSNLASVLKSDNSLEDSRSAWQECLKISRNYLGLQHPKTLEVQFNLAQTLYCLGGVNEMEALYRSNIEGWTHLEVDDSRTHLRTNMYELGRLLLERSEYQEAHMWAYRVYEYDGEIYGQNFLFHSSAVKNLETFLLCLRGQEKEEELRKFFVQVINWARTLSDFCDDEYVLEVVWRKWETPFLRNLYELLRKKGSKRQNENENGEESVLVGYMNEEVSSKRK
jgi:tetratricopeptide (TPR) repeat protein